MTLPTSPEQTMTKATARACHWLRLSNATIGHALGISVHEAGGVLTGEFMLQPDSPQGQAALRLVRISQFVVQHVGDDLAQIYSWMSSFNSALDGTPLKLIETASGLERVLSYLESQSA